MMVSKVNEEKIRLLLHQIEDLLNDAGTGNLDDLRPSHMRRDQELVGGLALLWNGRRAARALAISERTLWGLTQRGDIPHVRIGRSVRYDPQDLQRWVSRNKSNIVESSSPEEPEDGKHQS